MLDERNERLQGTVASIADGVSGFVGRPGATVRVIAKQSGTDWRRYTQRVGHAFADTNHLTETLRRGLPGIDRGPGWRSQRAAVDALAHPDAEYAVVAEAGDDGPVTVVTFQRDKDDLVVVGGGTTFPSAPAGVLADASLPSGEQAGYAVQYALASIAAQETLTLSHRVSPDTWHGPRALEARRMIGANGQSRSTKAAAQTWPADDVRHIAEQVALRQQDGRDPFPQVGSAMADGQGPRRWATELKGWIDRGGTIEVYDHGNPEDRDAAGLAMLELAQNSDYLAQNPIPDKPGVRTMVAMADGQPRGLVTAGRNADGNVQVLRFLGSADTGAFRATECMMFEAARRSGGAVSFSTAGALEYAKTAEYSISSADAATRSFQLQYNLRKLDRQSATRMTDLLRALDAQGEPAGDPEVLAAAVQRFREAGGDVLFLRPSEPTFVALQEQASETVWAAAEHAEGAVHPGVDGLWRAMNPPSSEGGQMVAVAVLDGSPVAAAAIKQTDARHELGALGAVPGADDALVAAVVQGAYSRAYNTQPLTMFLPDDEARSEQIAAVGLQVTEVRPLDDPSRVEVRLPDAWRQAVVTADAETGWTTARSLDLISDSLTRFQKDNGSVLRLDHAVAADRQLAAETVRDVQADNPVGQSELPVPPVNGNRVTVVARSDEHGPAYITFDETPAGEIEVVDVAAKGNDYIAREASRYWFCEQAARRDQEPALHERISDIERSRGTWRAAESKYLAAGMRNRLGDRAAELLRPAPELVPAAEPQAPGTADQGQSSPRRPDVRRRGSMER
ncbi:hypothetical protein JOF29_000533 [Kribbella aluminosa]|uniref:Uncharacterized protein n=1 Tax=Kribbella aluminosa TaxID=416017 RepID=A0ABS4UCU4_9ACTN|nr:hypothetical protein [Kribbella aluminosa]MBP2349450.1 hypothetical protein [Kribbella aluminosa]